MKTVKRFFIYYYYGMFPSVLIGLVHVYSAFGVGYILVQMS